MIQTLMKTLAAALLATSATAGVPITGNFYTLGNPLFSPAQPNPRFEDAIDGDINSCESSEKAVGSELRVEIMNADAEN